MHKCWLVLAAIVLSSIAAFADQPAATQPSFDWPQFLGPDRDAASKETGLLHEWPKEGPKVLWRAPIGIGWASISSAGDDVLVASMDGPGETVRCLDVATGKEKWNHGYKLGAPTWAWGVGWDKGGTRATPLITDKYVYACGILGDTYCLDRKDGSIVWRRGFLDGQKPKNPGDWKGFYNSPLIVGNALCLGVAGGPKWAFTTWNIQTGKDLWTVSGTGMAKGVKGGASQVTVAKFGKEDCFLVQMNGYLKAFRATDGKEIWTQAFYTGRGAGIPTPLVVDNYILAQSDADYAKLVEIDRAKEAFEGKQLWAVNHLAARWSKDDPYVSFYQNWVHRDGFLYGFAWPEPNMDKFETSPAYLICVELKTGKLMWSEKVSGHGTSLIAADGMLYARSYQTLMLVECNPKAFTLKGKLEKIHNASNATNPGQIDWTMPTLANGKLFVRLPSELICYDVKDPNAKKAK